jgi:hypothetical protein
MSLDAMQKFWAIMSAVCGCAGLFGKLLWDIRGKWDETNHMLLGLVRTVAEMGTMNSQDHARMDRRTDKLEDRIIDHIGRHRRM